MRKATKLYILLGVLVVICVGAFAVSHHEEKKEEIKNSGEVILELPAENVTALSWTNETGTFSFTKGETWVYDDDNAFPVDEEKIGDLLEQFGAFTAAFVIEDVDDYAQYGLDEPICTITVTLGEESHTVQLGDFSKMDEQRYISIGDGKAYLVEHDPLEEYDAVLEDMILDDTIPEYDTAEQVVFTGSENYTIVRDEEAESICEEDVFFADSKPLDTENVDSYLSELSLLSLHDYVSYNVSDAELETFGMTEPDLTVQVDYSLQDEEGNTSETGSFRVSISRNVEELAAYEEAAANEEEDLPTVTRYARIDDSQIIYEITESEYDALMAASYDDLRHLRLFNGDFETVTSIEVALDGETYTFTCTPPAEDAEEDAESVWTYQDAEFEVSELQTALRAISAAEFTAEEPEGKEEISLTVHLDNEDFPTFTLTLYRYNGLNCLAVVDGEPVAFVTRSKTVDLMEAVYALVLGE